MRILWILVAIFLNMGCFLDSRISSTSDGLSSVESSNKVTATLTQLNSSQPLSKTVFFNVEFANEVDSLNENNFITKNSRIIKISGGPKLFKVEVKADSENSLASVQLAENVVFRDPQLQLRSIEGADIRFTPKQQVIQTIQSSTNSAGSSSNAVQGADGSVYLLGAINSWTTAPSLFGNVATYDQNGNRLTVENLINNSDDRIIYKFPDQSYLFFNNVTSFCNISKYSSAGVLDASFAPITLAYQAVYEGDPYFACSFVEVNTGILQANGNILIGGKFGRVNGADRFGLVRFSSTGVVDTTFTGSLNNWSDTVTDIAELSDQKLLIFGNFTMFNGTASANKFVKTSPNGVLDATFMANRCCAAPNFANIPLNLQATYGKYPKLLVKGNGKVILMNIQNFTGGANSVGIDQFNTDGVKDLTFAGNVGTTFTAITPPSGVPAPVSELTAYLQSDNKIVILVPGNSAGRTLSFNGQAVNHVFRLNDDGTLDSSFGFNPPYGVTISLNGSNQIVINHARNSYDPKPNTQILKLQSNGTIHPSQPTLGALNGQILQMTSDASGRLLFGGNFSTYGGQPRNRFMRVDSNLALDTSFDMSVGFNANPTNISVLKNGNIFVSGYMTLFKGQSVGKMVLLDSAGNLVTGINQAGVSAGSYAYSKLLQNDDLLIWGDFTHYQGVAVTPMIRVSANLTRNLNFNPKAGWTEAGLNFNDICEYSNGKLLFVGVYLSGFTLKAFIKRTGPDGTIDSDDILFNSIVAPATTSTSMSSCTILKDDTAIIGGQFSQFAGVSRQGLVRVKYDGSIDTDFLVDASHSNGRITASNYNSPAIKFFNFPNFSILTGLQGFTFDSTNHYMNFLFMNPL